MSFTPLQPCVKKRNVNNTLLLESKSLCLSNLVQPNFCCLLLSVLSAGVSEKCRISISCHSSSVLLLLHVRIHYSSQQQLGALSNVFTHKVQVVCFYVELLKAKVHLVNSKPVE